MTKLRIAETLSLPIDAATQTFAFIARKGAGKTYAAGKLAELLLEAGVQIVVLDTVGNWYGLRLAADGKGKGFDVPVFGGLRGDLPLQATAGELIADVAVDSGRSLILDLSQFSLGDRKRFATAFGERLWKKKKAESHPSPLFLIIEESQLIVPQQVTGGGDTARMVGIYEEIVRLGRNYGIGCAMITQRPQSVNKEVLNQAECLFVLQVNGAQERKALREWVTHQGMKTEIIDELPTLPIGTAFVWSPQWLGILEKVKVAKKKTFDASATPKVGDRTERRAPAPLDLTDLEKRMAATVEAAKACDPRELRKQVEQLKRELAETTKSRGIKVELPKKVEVPVLKDAQIARLEKVAAALLDLHERFDKLGAKLSSAAHGLALPIQNLVGEMRSRADGANGFSRPASAVTPAPASRVAHQRTSVPTAGDQSSQAMRRNSGEAHAHNSGAGTTGGAGAGENVTVPQQRILDALASLEALGLHDVDKSNVAVFSDQSPTSSGYTNNLGRLRTLGLIHYPSVGRVALTGSGRANSNPSLRIQTRDDLHRAWFSKLATPKVRILEQLISVYPDAIDKATLAGLAVQSPTSSGYTNNLGNLRTLGLIDYPQTGFVAATELLFPPNL